MSKLLRADLYRLWRTKSYFVCVAVAAALAIFGVVMTQVSLNVAKAAVATQPSLQVTVDAVNKVIKQGGIGNLGTSMSGGTIPLLLAIVVSIFICLDFSSGAIKNTHGFCRTATYSSKLIVNVIAALIMTVVYMAFSFAASSIAWGVGKVDNDIILGLLKMIGTQSLIVIGCVSLFVMVAMLVRSSGGTIAINLGSLMLVSIILNLINRVFTKDIVLNKYWIGDASAYVASLNPANDDIIRSLIVAGCYIVIATAIGIFTFQKRDIK